MNRIEPLCLLAAQPSHREAGNHEAGCFQPADDFPYMPLPDSVRLYQKEGPVQVKGFRQGYILFAGLERVNETLDPVSPESHLRHAPPAR